MNALLRVSKQLSGVVFVFHHTVLVGPSMGRNSPSSDLVLRLVNSIFQHASQMSIVTLEPLPQPPPSPSLPTQR